MEKNWILIKAGYRRWFMICSLCSSTETWSEGSWALESKPGRLHINFELWHASETKFFECSKILTTLEEAHYWSVPTLLNLCKKSCPLYRSRDYSSDDPNPISRSMNRWLSDGVLHVKLPHHPWILPIFLVDVLHVVSRISEKWFPRSSQHTIGDIPHFHHSFRSVLPNTCWEDVW